MSVTAALVKELREKSGAGMMDCKKALDENGGDIDAAIDWLRTKGLATAAKKSGRVAAEGLVAIAVAGTKGAVVELNAETDFVARDDSFVEFTSQTLKSFSENPEKTLSELMDDGVEDNREKIVQKLGENIVVRRVAKTESSTITGSYLHSNNKIVDAILSSSLDNEPQLSKILMV